MPVCVCAFVFIFIINTWVLVLEHMQWKVNLTFASITITSFASHHTGKTALVPLSGSMYVQAVLENTDKVLVDIGTGYFVRKTIKEAQEFYKRKIAFLEENCEKIQAVLTQKRMQRDVVIDVLQMRLQAQAAAQSAAGGSAVQASA
eukprot:Opistho-2@50605